MFAVLLALLAAGCTPGVLIARQLVKAPNRQLYTSRITVLKALASASGFTDYANKKKVKLTRADGRTQIINCAKARDNPILDLEVYPGDKLYVPRRFW